MFPSMFARQSSTLGKSLLTVSITLSASVLGRFARLVLSQSDAHEWKIEEFTGKLHSMPAFNSMGYEEESFTNVYFFDR